jgi:hypothetical protein
MSKINSGLKRDTIDKFYTKSITVKKCIEHIKEYNFIKNNDLIIEPSAGDGSFLNNIKELSDFFLFFDIKPENKEIKKQDFLKWKGKNLKKYKNIHFIGNPPFGRQSSTALKFIKKACEFENTKSINFILPKSFKKNSLKNKIPIYFHLISEIDLPPNSFYLNDETFNVPCIFQIWKKKKNKRIKYQKQTPSNFCFVKKDENPDLAFRRVGVYAGKTYTDIDDKSNQSHYFIKFNNDKDIDYCIEKLKSIKFEESNTVGPKSISKQELIEKWNNFF